jgi:hypothetical protein
MKGCELISMALISGSDAAARLKSACGMPVSFCTLHALEFGVPEFVIFHNDLAGNSPAL